MTPPAAAPAALSFVAPDTWNFSGRWTALGLGELAATLEDDIPAANGNRLVLDGSQVEALDSVGAWMLQRWRTRLEKNAVQIEWRGWNAAQRALLDRAALAASPAPPTLAGTASWPARIGQAVLDSAGEARALLGFVGEGALSLVRVLADPRRLRWRAFLSHLGTTGLRALGIVGLLSFLMGVVVAYQGANQLRRYGANILVVDLVGLSMLREFAPLLTAIIVAGRSGAAYAAQLGTMVVTEEIDAMRTLGLSPIELLVLPRLFALLVSLPLLTMFADLLGLAGGMLMAAGQLGVGYRDFLTRLPNAVQVSTLLLGVGKAPVFAAVIATVGCFQGLRTRGGADSVGNQTTHSVVQSIFLVIVADALFSVAFSMLNL